MSPSNVYFICCLAPCNSGPGFRGKAWVGGEVLVIALRDFEEAGIEGKVDVIP